MLGGLYFMLYLIMLHFWTEGDNDGIDQAREGDGV